MDNFFISPKLLRYLKSKGIAATGTVRVNRIENVPLKDMKLMQKEKCGSFDVVTDISSNVTAIRWKDNKFVNGLSTYTGKEPMPYVKRFCHSAKKKVDIKYHEQPKIIRKYNKSMRVKNSTYPDLTYPDLIQPIFMKNGYPSVFIDSVLKRL